ncbi:MAG: hypothetical protein P8X55_09405 [Desulfosarcinaceae bacterium]
MKKVSNGFHNFKEINRVTYDSSKISPNTMVEALKKAGTYIGTVEK